MELILRVWAGSQEVGLEAKEVGLEAKEVGLVAKGVGLVARGWGWRPRGWGWLVVPYLDRRLLRAAIIVHS